MKNGLFYPQSDVYGHTWMNTDIGPSETDVSICTHWSGTMGPLVPRARTDTAGLALTTLKY